MPLSKCHENETGSLVALMPQFTSGFFHLVCQFSEKQDPTKFRNLSITEVSSLTTCSRHSTELISDFKLR